MLRTHYRQPIDWTVKALEESEKTLQRFAEASTLQRPRRGAVRCARRGPVRRPQHPSRNRPSACASRRGANERRGRRQLRADAGFLVSTSRASLRARGTPEAIAEIERLVAERDEARKRRDWAESDRLRDELAALGVAVKDSKSGATWEFKR